MSSWGQLPLRRLADCWDHLRIPLNAEERHHRPGDIPYWGANSIQGYVDEPLVSEEVVLIGEDGAPFFDRDRPVAFHSVEPIWPNNHIHLLKPNHNVDARWLAYALNDVDYSPYVLGATRDKLTQGALMRITLTTPPRHIQSAIADYLDRETARIDTLIEEQQRLIDLLRERRRSATSDLLGTRVGEGTRLKWSFNELDRRAGVEADTLPLMSVSISWGVRRRDEVVHDESRAEDLSNHKICRRGDLVINRMRAFQGALGLAQEDGLVSPDYAVLRAKPEVNGEWLASVMKSDVFVSEMSQRVKGIGSTNLGSARTPRINIADLGEIRIGMPETEQQVFEARQIRTQTTKIDTLIEETKRFIELSKERRAALITAAVTGQIDVREAA